MNVYLSVIHCDKELFQICLLHMNSRLICCAGCSRENQLHNSSRPGMIVASWNEYLNDSSIAQSVVLVFICVTVYGFVNICTY